MYILKIGGSNDSNIEYIARDLAARIQSGEQYIIVHGAHEERDELCKKLNIKARTITSPSGMTSRYTDEDTIEAILMAYAGLKNKKIVQVLQQHRVNAVGISGIDGRLLEGKRKNVVLSVENGKTKALRDNLTGSITSVNIHLLELLLSNNYVPVVSIPAISQEHEIINVDNDRVIAAIAQAMKIPRIISLFSAPGLLRNASDEASLISNIHKEELEQYMQYAQGGMKQKVLGAITAIKSGVKQIYWADGRIIQPITNALNGGGTIIQ